MKQSETRKICKTLERLAYGKVNDAVELVFAEEALSPEKLARMNLINVSSIKRIKGGGVEIQFFDRQKALERLFEYAKEGHAEEQAATIFAALTGEACDES